MRNFKLNTKHLRYFWAVASHESLVKAAEAMHVTPQTISGQLRELEQQLGKKLFSRAGRNLVLTETGRMVFSYADEMFRIGLELQDVLAGHTPGSKLDVKVGIATAIPKLLAYRVLEPVLQMPAPVRLICHEASLPDLLGDLSLHKLDVVLADSPVNAFHNIRAYNHALGSSGISFCVQKGSGEQLRKDFPVSLNGTSMLMPGTASSLRRSLETWFDRRNIVPLIVAEFEDRALMKAFGERGTGVFTTPTAVEEDVLEKYEVEIVGRTNEVKENFYIISAERRIKHPAVSAILDAARNELFS